MPLSNIKKATIVLSVAILAFILVPTLFFPKASCLSTGPHYYYCRLENIPTLLVLLVAILGLPIVTWMIDPQ